jgi:hypothetical protein
MSDLGVLRCVALRRGLEVVSRVQACFFLIFFVHPFSPWIFWCGGVGVHTHTLLERCLFLTLAACLYGLKRALASSVMYSLL